jgi:hypothetical protein
MPAYVSTIEALAHVLGVLEGDPERFQALLSPFRAMVKMQLDCEQRFHGGRTRHPRRGPRPRRRRLPAILHTRARDLLCVCGEANSWPYGSAEREGGRPEQIVHWTAFRPHTGERFEGVASPGTLAPRTAEFLALPDDAFAAAGAAEALHDRWRRFVRDTDVVCSWGTFATALFEREGGRLPDARVDLRLVTRAFSQGRPGSVDDVLPFLGMPVAAPLGQGRAGRRLGQLVELARFLGGEAEREAAASGRVS